MVTHRHQNGVTTYSYNVLNQMASRSRNGRTVSYAYTLSGQVGQVGYWNRGGVQYAHDAAGRLTGLAAWGASATSYAYRSTGLLASETRPNGVNTAYTYDTASRLTGVNGIGYILDANGNRTQMTDWEGMTTYSYDALDRLMQATYPTSTVTYTLDSVGNRLSDGMVSFAYDPSDRITNSGFTYDANGNLLADGAATYEYDAANRLIQMTRSGVVTTYGYEGWGNLVQETLTGFSQQEEHMNTIYSEMLQALLQFKCTAQEYRQIVKPYLTRLGWIRSFNLGNEYWQIIPIYIYARCPFCDMVIECPIDTYSLLGWQGAKVLGEYVYSRSYGVFGFPRNCLHFVGVHIFLNLHHELPFELSSFQNDTGEAPLITEWCLPDDIESYAVLHALPICRIEEDAFRPAYTLFSLTYFAEKPKEIVGRHYAAEWERGKGDPEFYPGGVQGPSTRPSAAKLYDLQRWATAGRLGYLDFTQEHLPLRIVAGTQLPELYQTIPGERRRYVWRNGQMVYYNR